MLINLKIRFYLELFAATKLLEYIVSASVGTTATSVGLNVGKNVLDILRDKSDQSEAKEVLKVARIAFLRATIDQALCIEQENSLKGQAAKNHKKLIKYLKTETNRAEEGKWFATAALDQEYDQISRDLQPGLSTKQVLKKSLLNELYREKIFPSNIFEKALEDGCKTNWFQQINDHFQVDLAENTVANNYYQNKLLQGLEDKINYLIKLLQKGLRGFQLNIKKELTNPPALSEVFLGREKDLNQLHKALLGKSGKQVQILVNGRGGIGKTSLAAQYYHQYLSAYDHLAWLSVTNGISEALISLQKEFGLEFQTETQKERRDIVLLKLAQLPGLKLLVLDNANDSEDLREHYDQLRAIKDLHLLITSRISNFRKADTLKIEGISEEATIQLFRTYYPDLTEEEESLVLAIRKAVNENTLVIELLSKNLSKVNYFGRVYTLKELLKDLMEKGVLQIAHSKIVELSYHEFKKASPEEVISAMYELYHLPKNEQQLLQCISLLPTESIPFLYMKSMLKEIEDFEDGLRGLVDKGWIEHDRESQTFKWSPVVQEVVRSKSDDLYEEAKLLIGNLAAALNDENIHQDNYADASHFVRYAENTCSHMKKESSKLLGELWQNIGSYYEHTGDLVKCMEAYTKMEQQFRAILVEGADPEAQNGLAISYEKLGETHSALGNLEEAFRFFENFSSLIVELFKDYPNNVSFKNGLAISYSKLGETHSALGNLEEAFRFFDDETELFEQLFKDYPNNVSFKNGLAISYSKLGETHSALGNLEEALRFFENDIDLSKQLFKDYPNNVEYKNNLAISYSKLGETHSALGNLEEALRLFEQRSELGKQLFKDYPNNVSFKNGLAISYEKLGETHSALGNLEEALRFFEQRSELGKQLFKDYPNNVSFKNGLAISYSKLGETHSALGNLGQALKFFDDETVLFEQLFKDYPNNVSFKNGLAISYSKLGETHSVLGNIDQALKFFEQRSELGRQLFKDYPNNISFKNGLAIAYEKLGKTHSALGNLEEALRFFDDETELFEQLFKDYPNNVSFKNGLAISYSKLGETHSALGNLEEALRFFEQRSELGKQLFKDYPNNVSFKNGLAISYSKLGETHSALGNLEEALRFFEKFSSLMVELFKDYPNKVEYKNNLAISYVKLGQTELQKEDLVAACARFQQAKMLWEELVVQSPQHAQFRRFLESISQMMKELGCEEPGTEN